MKVLSFDDIAAMKGNGSSMRTVLKYFIDKGATIELMQETLGASTERYFVVRYEELTIPLRAFNLNFYSIFNSHLARSITSDKSNSQATLEAWGVPTPATITYQSMDQALEFLSTYKTCVVKPRDGAHGDGITVRVTDPEVLASAVKHAQTIDSDVLIQQHVTGRDHRLLFIDYKFAAAVERKPAHIVGDGTHTIEELVTAANAEKSALWQAIRDGSGDADATRGSISKTPLAEVMAARGEAFLQTVPAEGESVQLIDKANVSLGGQTVDVTDQVSHELTDLLSTLLRQIDLPLCGVDVMSDDIGSPLADKRSFVIELNAAPGLRLHELPTEGEPHHVCAQVAESLIAYYRNLI